MTMAHDQPSMMMQDQEIELGFDQNAMDMLLERETERVAKFISEQMVEVLRGLENIIKSQAFTETKLKPKTDLNQQK